MWNKIKFNLTNKYAWLGYLIQFNDGFDFKQQQIDDKNPNHYTMGSSPLIKKVLQEDGQWIEYLPEDEMQRGRNVETMACVSFGKLNCIEILAKRLWNKEWNKSDRFTAKMSGTSRSGNIMSRVGDSVRNDGIVKQDKWENNIETFTWNEFYSEPTRDVKELGKNFIKKYSTGYEAVYNNKQTIKQALRFSPIWAAFCSWYLGSNGIYYKLGSPNHVACIVGYTEEYVLVYDSYAPHVKKVAWDNIFFPKIVTLNDKDQVFDKKKIQKLKERGLRYLILPELGGQLYKILEDSLEYRKGQVLTDEIIRKLEMEGKIVGISNKDFYALLV